MHKRIAFILAFIVTFIAVNIVFTLPRALPLFAAPSAQATLPNFTLDAQTVISVTVAISDGLVIVIPIDLDFVAQNRDGETDLTLITDVEQQAGIFIGVVPATAISATLQLPQSAGAAATIDTPAGTATVTPTAPRVVVGDGTHIANRNSNLRAGPGTNFDIVGNVRSGDAVTVIGENQDGTWLELTDGIWIAAFLVDAIEADDTELDDTDSETPVESEEADQGEALEENQGADEAQNDGDTQTDQATLATYLQEIITIGAQATSATNVLADLAQNPQPQNSAWRIDVSAQLDVLTNALDQYLGLTPIPDYESLHTQVTSVALTCEQAVDYLATGLADPLSINAALAMQSVQACSAGANALATTVQELQ